MEDTSELKYPRETRCLFKETLDYQPCACEFQPLVEGKTSGTLLAIGTYALEDGTEGERDAGKAREDGESETPLQQRSGGILLKKLEQTEDGGFTLFVSPSP
jgi:hypothetical protein